MDTCMSVIDMNLSQDLHTYGVVTIPVLQNHTEWANRIWEAIDEFPEYKVKGKKAQRVLGGFGAYGNPSSFHHPTIRAFRTELKKNITPLFKHYTQAGYTTATHLEMLMDRVCVRYKDFGAVSKESWHRDVYEGDKNGLRKLPPSDDIFGGWVNLSENTQEFVCLIGTHNDPHDGKKGFAPVKETEPLNRLLTTQANQTFGSTKTNSKGHILVPPGHAVVFFQHILHAVLAGKPPSTPELRMFCGYRLAHDSNPLITHDLENMSVPFIPSGQIPPMFSQNHYMFFNKFEKFRLWGENTFNKECLFARKTKEGEQTYYTPGSPIDVGDINKHRSMPSLKDMGFHFPPYSIEDVQILTPEPL